MTSRNPNRKRGYPYKRQMRRKLRKIALMIIVVAIAGGVNYYNTHYKNNAPISTNPATDKSINQADNQQQTIDKIRAAAKNTHSQFWVTVQGRVIKLLKDDRKGSQHQKFLIRIAPDVTLLISHNIDLAKRVPIKQGDPISLRGRYEWNNRGGLIHWTHHDPKGKKQGGWIQVNGKRYR